MLRNSGGYGVDQYFNSSSSSDGSSDGDNESVTKKSESPKFEVLEEGNSEGKEVSMICQVYSFLSYTQSLLLFVY